MKDLSSLLIPSIALGLAVLAAPAAAQPPAAQATAGFSAGATVRDTNGGEVGTVTRVDGDFLVVKTDRHEARLPASSFTKVDNGLLFGMTRDQLNAEIDKALAAANAKIVAGASVTGSGGAPVGTIEAVEAGWVTVKLISGTAVRLPRAAVAPGPNGAVIAMSAAELEAAAQQAAAGQAAQDNPGQ